MGKKVKTFILIDISLLLALLTIGFFYFYNNKASWYFLKNDIMYASGMADASYTDNYLSLDKTNWYSYNVLSDTEKIVYDEIYATIYEHGIIAEISTTDKASLEYVYKCVFADHGDIFWCNGCSISEKYVDDELVSLVFKPTYTMTLHERKKTSDDISQNVLSILKNAPTTGTDYEKIKFVFEYLAKNVTYDLSAPDNQNIKSVFLNKSSVCLGFSNAAQYLLSELGISSTVVTGTLYNVPHSWNLVLLDGNYYYFDFTMAAAVVGSDFEYPDGYMNYSYFGLTDTELALTHDIEPLYELPSCNQVFGSYFYNEGLYFDGYDEATVANTILQYHSNGAKCVSIKFTNKDAYYDAKRALCSEDRLSYYTEEDYAYLSNMKHRILTFCFE